MNNFAEIISKYRNQNTKQMDMQDCEDAVKEINNEIKRIGEEYIAERRAEMFLSGEVDENGKVDREEYWTGLRDGAKELLRRLT